MKKKPHYYYKYMAGSDAGKAIQAFMAECQEASETARQWAEKQGADAYYESPVGMAGGINAVEFDRALGKQGWEAVNAPDGRRLFIPEADSELEKEMMALPVVSEAKLIGILSLKPKTNADTGRTLPFTFGDETPIIFLHHGFWYADVPYESADTHAFRIEEKEFYRRKMAATNEHE